VSDHFFASLGRYGGPDRLQGSVEPFTALAALAVSTERIGLGTLVACAPFRHPAHVAKMATSIDLASEGRFDLGLGAGWYEGEFQAFGYEFGSIGDRFSMLEESVQVVTALLGEGPVSFEGRHYRLAEAFNRPRPAREGGPPIWVGGKGGDRLLRLTARHGSGWNSVWRWAPGPYAERVGALRRISESEGRDPSSVRLSVGLYALVGEDERDLVARYRALQRWAPGGALDGEPLEDYARESLAGTPESCLGRLGEFAELGVEEMILSAASLPFAVYDWSMVELIGEALIPDAHKL
jgi:alkanesulfonate monooxygenase SsuD/methylene tetrahydromethanopterin reductase-like flavin-dependent oxidoreductase (luciferase family)